MSKIFASGILVAGLLYAAAPASAQSLADVLHSQRQEGARICLVDHSHYGAGSGSTRAAAERDAVGAWSGFTSFEYGDNWGRWSLAASKTMNCSQSGGSWSCGADARPCRSIASAGGGARARARKAN